MPNAFFSDLVSSIAERGRTLLRLKTWPTDAAEYDPVIVDGTPLPDETDTNPDHYFGVDATIEVIKSTNTVDADEHQIY